MSVSDSTPDKKSFDEFLQFSRITRENWLAPDRKDYVPLGVTQEQWTDLFLGPQLDLAVPQNVIRLFEVARGSMIYSWFFYPLATLGFEQSTRIAELAVWERCRLLQRESDYFSENLRTLTAARVISADDAPRWQTMRELRNDRSHPKNFTLLDPVQAADLLQTTAELINGLFSSPGNAST